MGISDLQTVELYIEPIIGELAENILNSKSVNKIYLTRISEFDVNSKNMVNKSTPLFTYSFDEDNSTNENVEIEHAPDKSLMTINSDYSDDESNISQSGKDYIASEPGLFIIHEGYPKIIPIDLDGSCDVRISEDSMSVHVDIYPSIDNNPITTLDDILEKIKKLGVVTDINQQLLTEKLYDVEQNKIKFLNLCVSEGKAAVDGLDGRLENCTGEKEEIANFDFGEFHKVNPVISVKEEQLIAIIHPPTNGEKGYDILGNDIEPKPGKIFALRLGSNTCFSEDNGNHIIAKKDGFLDLSDTSISITDTFTVKGDIDFESGNIIAKGSLKVVGDVKNEFTLSLSKDIEIGGYVGDAIVEAGQNIIVQGGFLGKGKGVLKSNGDIEVKFVENQKVYSRGSLHLVKDTLNAKLFIKNKISCKGNQSSIIGGHTIAGESIEICNLGNNIGTETIVEVGFDYLKRDSIINNKEKQIALRKNLEEVDKSILEFAKMKRLNTQSGEKVKILANEHKKLVAEIDSIKEQNLKITNEIYLPTSSKISVNGSIYPGVKIGINGRFLTINEVMKAKTFVLSSDDEIIAM
jgi:uncharacterized protein